VFNLDNHEQARAVQVRFGRLSYDGRYRWTDFSGDVDDLRKITKTLAKFYEENFVVRS